MHPHLHMALVTFEQNSPWFCKA